MICTFCYNKGIPAPHNHSVRHWTMQNRPIICPQLLSTQCTNCSLMGHTKLYCPTKKNNSEDNTDNREKNNKKRDLEALQQHEENTAKYQKNKH